jgi:hypothetical protein
MRRDAIAKAKARTVERAIRSGHDLHLIYRGGAHKRWACFSCGEHFVIEEFHPPEHPEYYDGNAWTPCPNQATIAHLFCEDPECHKYEEEAPELQASG